MREKSSSESSSVRFLYGTAPGRALLHIIMKGHLDKPVVGFLRSGLSRGYARGYARKLGLDLSRDELDSFGSYRDFFLRGRDGLEFDMEPTHLISPCDGWLSAFKVNSDSQFDIKGSVYGLADLFDDPFLASRFSGGDCLIFRLCPSDYHHYFYIDDCIQGENHFIPGELHSVQPIACRTKKVYTLNRRNWSLLDTANFGLVVQVEVGALVVGGIVNGVRPGSTVKRSDEKGYFDLAGSTIVLFFEKDRIRLLPEIKKYLAGSSEDYPEFRVTAGQQIGEKC